MNPRLRRNVGISLTTIVLASVLWVNAGNLTPPAGPVGDTYLTLGFKTLQQVEPRTPVDKLPGTTTALYAITAPGSYYLTGNITGVAGKNAIEISSDGVTLDLSGFAIDGVPSALSGISEAGTTFWRGVTIRNGSISNWPVNGIQFDQSWNCSYENLHIYSCSIGIFVGYNSRINGCTIQDCVLDGIFGGNGLAVTNTTTLFMGEFGISTGTHASLINCTSEGCGMSNFSLGNGGSMLNCTSHATNTKGAGSPGIKLGDNCSLSDCVSSDNHGNGVDCGSRCSFSGCDISNNLSGGINGFDDITVAHCTCSGNFGIGVFIDGGAVTDTTANHNSDRGISSFGQSMTVTNCNAANNGTVGIVIDGGGRAENCTTAENFESGVRVDLFFGAPSFNAADVVHCTSSQNLNDGIESVIAGTTIRACTCRNNTNNGIEIADRCEVVDNFSETNGSSAPTPGSFGGGIRVNGGGSRIDSNHFVHNDAAIVFNGSGNTAIRNSFKDNTTTNIQVVGTQTNDVAPSQTGAAGTSPWANIAF